MRRLFFSLALTLCLPQAFAASNAGKGEQNPLPLDKVPNAVLATPENSDYLPDRVIVKIMPGALLAMTSTGFGIPAIDDLLSSVSVRKVGQMFPDKIFRKALGEVDLGQFYVVHYSAPVDPFSISADLSRVNEVHYAEPWFIYQTSYDPNDPSYGSQYALPKIEADAAWDLTQGDENVVIGIVDSGVDLDHPDLSGNIWHNPGELGTDSLGRDKTTNNFDDDGNGYIDDWQGWDFGGADYNNVVPDNNPRPTGTNNAHGTHVGGIASASTDNGIGVAGTAFNCTLLPIKTSADNDTRDGGNAFIISGYEGITYAAAMGADVMNCSWGGGGGSQVLQEIIDWATDQGTLVVAAAGNSSSSDPHYPSAYHGVISVASTNSGDIRSSFSNYGHTVDVAAPGDAIFNTYYPSTYASLWGTSMSSPHAAGAAALIKTMNPSFTALQVGERMRVTADDINGLNPSYTDLLGKGRINIYRALTEDPPSLRALEITFSDSAGGNNNGNLEPGEDITVVMTFTNYLAPTSNAIVTLTETSAYVTMVDDEYTVGALGTLESVSNSAEPFQFSVDAGAPEGHVATFKLLIDDGTYTDYQWFQAIINPTFQAHNINDVHVTMTNNGRIGFNDYPDNSQGIGFLYPSTSLNHIFEGALIIGHSATKLVNNMRDNSQQNQDNDFLASGIYDLQTPGIISNQDGFTTFSDELAPSANEIGLQIDQYSYAFSSPQDSDFVLVRYDIENLTGSTVSGLYVGQFFDWDIASFSTNRTDYDAARDMAYAWDDATPDAPYIGVRAYHGAASVRGLVNSGLTIDRSSKWDWISGGTALSTVGPGDIFYVISSGPYSIDAGATITVAFGMIGGEDLASLETNADVSVDRWEEIELTTGVGNETSALPITYALEQNYPNPFNPETVIGYQIPEASHVTLTVFNLLGQEVARLVDERQSQGTYTVRFRPSNLPTGLYFYQLSSGSFNETKKLMLLK